MTYCSDAVFAKWKPLNTRGNLCDTWQCSECGAVVMPPDGFTRICDYSYCPYCGEPMEDYND